MRHHGKALAGIARAGGLDRGVERQQIGLHRDRANMFRDFRGLFQRGLQIGQQIGGIAHGGGQLLGLGQRDIDLAAGFIQIVGGHGDGVGNGLHLAGQRAGLAGEGGGRLLEPFGSVPSLLAFGGDLVGIAHDIGQADGQCADLAPQIGHNGRDARAVGFGKTGIRRRAGAGIR